jgi:predicted nucleotidyltransferase
MEDSEVLKFIYDRLSARFAIERLILFGSRARGSAQQASDYDVLVVAESEIPFVERQGQALLALGRRSFPVDLLVYTPRELESEAAIRGSAVYWALQEGTVYAG